MARPNNLCGGCRSTFPRHMSDSLLDLRSIRLEIEKAEARAEDRSLALWERRMWHNYRDTMETALDLRIELMQRSADSHERAIAGQAMTACRMYELHDPSHRQLCAMAQQSETASVLAADGVA